jgi:hypothetical protein
MAIVLDGTNGITTETGSGDVSVGDDLIFTGTGNRITGDFSNATHANRVAIQTSTVNGATSPFIIPNGTGNIASLVVANSSDPTNCSFLQTFASSTETRINSGQLGTGTNLPMAFYTGGSERARIDSSGNLFVGKTANTAGVVGWTIQPQGAGNATFTLTDSNEIFVWNNTATTGTAIIDFRTANTSKGRISWNNTNTTYATTSDYRLKHDIQPMTGALAKVQQLKPVTYKWNADDSESQGFIAHELQAVVPECVTGEKDAVDADGKPVYQGIDTSFLVATLTAAIQEQQAIITALTARVEALEGAQG